MNKLTTATLLITIFVSPIALHAEAFPSKPIRIIVPFNSGGSVDAVVRLAAQKLTAGLGQPFVIENRPGAGGIVGTEYVAKSTQDGYTLLATPSAFVMNVALSKSPSYDPVRDFETISILASYPLLLVSHPSLPVRNLKDLIALAKSQPRNLNYSSGGIGTSNHVAAELFGYLAGVKLTHVAYKGGGPAFTALIGGEVHIMFAAAPTTMPHIKSGKLRVLGVSTAKRSNFFPDIPTISENALLGFEVNSWSGLFAPMGTPLVILKAMNSEISKGFKQADVMDILEKLGLESATGSLEDAASMIKAEVAKWIKIVKATGIKPQ
jgi:tripartite-type tricarboxylate transporter receptor subunit TctC